MKILLVEDDRGIARFVKKGLLENARKQAGAEICEYEGPRLFSDTLHLSKKGFPIGLRGGHD